MKEIEDLCETLKRGGYKSKQAIFNHYLEDFCDAKDRYGWREVVEFINKETGVPLNIETYRSMLKRAKKKTSSKNKNTTLPEGKPEKKEVSQKTNLLIGKQAEGAEIEQNEYKIYLNSCFGNEKIAQRAIENNVSIETIKSWNCANVVQISNSLGNYLRNKGVK